jgi:hypothetical protein
MIYCSPSIKHRIDLKYDSCDNPYAPESACGIHVLSEVAFYWLNSAWFLMGSSIKITNTLQYIVVLCYYRVITLGGKYIMKTSYIVFLSILLGGFFIFSYSNPLYAQTTSDQEKSDSEECDCEDCDVNCVCVITPCECLCADDSKSADANLGLELDSIVAFRNIQNMKLGKLVEILQANSSVDIELPTEKEEEKVSFELVGVEFQEVLKHLGLKYK